MIHDVETHFQHEFPKTINTVFGKIGRELALVGYTKDAIKNQ